MVFEEIDRRAYAQAIKNGWYRRARERTIAALGGCCRTCGTTENLHICHKTPAHQSGSSGKRTGAWKVREWKRMVAEDDGFIACEEHHIEGFHGGNTNSIKKGVL